MRFTVDGGELAVVLGRDTEPAEVDLTRDGLGDRSLDAVVEGMFASHRMQTSPNGQAWAPLSPATVRRKGNAVIRVQSRTLLDPQRWRATPRDLMPRAAVWYDRAPAGRATGVTATRAFHAGPPLTGSPARRAPAPPSTHGSGPALRPHAGLRPPGLDLPLARPWPRGRWGCLSRGLRRGGLNSAERAAGAGASSGLVARPGGVISGRLGGPLRSLPPA